MPVQSAPAKVNLGLHVLRKRPDGYHDLATVFQPIGWADTLSAGPARRLALATDDPALKTDPSNLVVRAAMALRVWAGDAKLGAQIHLAKRVPYGAGLGGGSSDAAATLRVLAELWRLKVPDAVLRSLALGLGSDVPFFLDPVPSAATGRGEALTPLVDADGARWRCPFSLVVAVPYAHISTAQAFVGVTPDDRDRPDLAAAVTSDDIGRWRAEVTNDFQPSVEAAFPTVATTRGRLEDAGADHTVLSGTGSAVVGVFTDAAAAAAARKTMMASTRVWMEPAAR
ncbi:4-(cytidine 5'-diphospho)-2-C-methyl-D-erythritol kinase [Rubrivirga sp. IMCC43871]|uniref:4-(cytidine 5'-diphospho)-2-C-methyl-D-erythritol kinase n=1 Tax=Rubrivirga sp. IMCC43871 TaxID=3391575 RepID=UPI003990389A